MCFYRAPNTCNAKHSLLKRGQSGNRSLRQQADVSHTTRDKCAHTRVKHNERQSTSHVDINTHRSQELGCPCSISSSTFGHVTSTICAREGDCVHEFRVRARWIVRYCVRETMAQASVHPTSASAHLHIGKCFQDAPSKQTTSLVLRAVAGLPPRSSPRNLVTTGRHKHIQPCVW